MELTNQEIAKVFAMYLGSEVKVKAAHFAANNNSKNNEGKTIMSPSILADCHERTFQYLDFLLKLTPLSKISDEDAVQVAKILHSGLSSHIHFTVQKEDNRTDVWFGYNCVRIYHDGSIHYDNGNMHWANSDFYQFLISRSYAVPLWHGIDHPANGKTAIELGIAIDRTPETIKPL